MGESFDLSAVSEGKPLNQCLHCDYATEDKSNFNKHIRRKHSETSSSSNDKKNIDSNFLCDNCGKGYKTRYGLYLHRKNMHTKDFKYTCPICKRGFNQTTQYRFHAASHGNVGLEKCDECNIEFKSNGSLERHNTSYHSNEKNKYICHTCGAGFPQRYKLQEHVNGKHGEPRYRCVCGKNYGWRSSLRAHKKLCALTKPNPPEDTM